MPKIIDDTIDELINLDGNYQKDNNIIWNLGLKLVITYMTFSLLKGVFLFFLDNVIYIINFT